MSLATGDGNHIDLLINTGVGVIHQHLSIDVLGIFIQSFDAGIVAPNVADTANVLLHFCYIDVGFILCCLHIVEAGFVDFWDFRLLVKEVGITARHGLLAGY